MNIKTVELEFKKDEEGIGMVDITRPVEHSVVDSLINNGIVTISSANPNVCVTTMEFEPGAKKDLQDAFERIAPKSAHEPKGHHEMQDIRPSLLGPSITIPFKDNRIMVGKWQQIVMIDFDGAENRKKIVVQIMGE